MRKSRLPNPSTAEDLIGARLNDPKKEILEAQLAAAGSTPSLTPSWEGNIRYIVPGWEFSHTEGSGLIAFGNQVNCFRFRLLFELNDVSTLTTYLTSVGAMVGIGIFGLYNGAGALLCQWTIDASFAGIGPTAWTSDPLFQPIDLEPGDYWLAWSCQGFGGIATAFNGPIVSWLVVLGAGEVRMGIAGNPMVLLTLPSVLGGVTAPGPGIAMGVPCVCINTLPQV